MASFEVDSSSFANGACEDGIPSAEEREEEQENNRTNFRNIDIMI